MNIWLLLVGGIVFAAVVYQIRIGKAPDPFPSQYATQRSVDRKTRPVLFWLAIGIQFILGTVALYFAFQA
jgi:hypothetical protein